MGAFAYCSCGAALQSPCQLDDDELLACVIEGGLICSSCDNAYYNHVGDITEEWVKRSCDLKERVETLELELSKSNRRLSRLERMLEEK